MHNLKIVDLTVKVDDRVILNKFNLEIKSGEIHAIMVNQPLQKLLWVMTIMRL